MRYATRVEGLGGAEAAAWDIHNEAVARRARGEDVILLSIGDPDFPFAPIPGATVSADRSTDAPAFLATPRAWLFPVPAFGGDTFHKCCRFCGVSFDYW